MKPLIEFVCHQNRLACSAELFFLIHSVASITCKKRVHAIHMHLIKQIHVIYIYLWNAKREKNVKK